MDLVPQGSIGQCLEMFWVETKRKKLYWHLQVEVRDAAECCTTPRTAHYTKNYPAPNANGTEAETC